MLSDQLHYLGSIRSVEYKFLINNLNDFKVTKYPAVLSNEPKRDYEVEYTYIT